MTTPPPPVDGLALAARIQAGELTATDAAAQACERILRLDPDLGAIVPGTLVAGTPSAVPERLAGPLAGVPTLLKDLGCRARRLPLTDGLRLLRDLGAARANEDDDGPNAARLRSLGLVPIGRTTTSELGLLPTAGNGPARPTRNPWAPDRSSGGSSGGAAAAVAAGLVLVAHANDGAGSIRVPAGACGVVGFKPSHPDPVAHHHADRLLDGMVTDHVITRSVRDTAAAWRPAVPEPTDEPSRLRIGMVLDAPGGYVDTAPECRDAAVHTACALTELGHVVEELDAPSLADRAAVRARGRLWLVAIAQLAATWERRLGRRLRPDDVEASTWVAIERGSRSTPADVATLLDDVARWRHDFAAVWSDVDVVLTPTTSAPPLPLRERDGDRDPERALLRGAEYAPFTSAWNITGEPAISLPLHWTADGLPIGVQLVAGRARDSLLLRLAAQLELARPWAHRYAALA